MSVFGVGLEEVDRELVVDSVSGRFVAFALYGLMTNPKISLS